MEVLTYGDGSYRFSQGRFVKNAYVFNKRVLLRCDLNVPISDGKIKDSTRIDESLPTVKYLIGENAKVIICSHLGRPKGKFEQKLSLAPVCKYMSDILGKEIKLVDIGSKPTEFIDNMEFGGLCMLENLRFNEGEENNDNEFALKLANLADVYVNDAFGTCHREHASIVAVPKIILGFYGFLIQKEINKMSSFIKNLKKPFMVILGGAKISDKIKSIKNLLNKVQVMIIGGGMAYTFLSSLGYQIGDSICDKDSLSFAKDIINEAKEKNVKFLLPIDLKIGREFSPETQSKYVDIDGIPGSWQGLDIGPKTVEMFINEIKNVNSLYWNGPLGVSEWKQFENGTFSIAKAIAESDVESIIGGGDSGEAIKRMGLKDKVSHISTGGGSSIKFIEGEELVGLRSLV